MNKISIYLTLIVIIFYTMLNNAIAETCPIAKAALITTAGNSNSVGSLSQSFKIPPAYTDLVGRVLFLSNEWPTYFGSEFNDNYLARISTTSGTSVLASGNLNSSSWSAGSNGFSGKSIEKNFTFDLSPHVGKKANLYFEVRDVGDQVVDSGLAIADIGVKRTETYVLAKSGIPSAGPVGIKGNFGQAVKITFKNHNILGVSVRVRDLSSFGQTKQSIILPGLSVTFIFSKFGTEPMFWNFGVSTMSDAYFVSYEVYSTWVEGMPNNPCF